MSRPLQSCARGTLGVALRRGFCLLLGFVLLSPAACSEDDLRDKWYGTDVGVGYTLPDATADGADGTETSRADAGTGGAEAPVTAEPVDAPSSDDVGSG